MSIPPTYPKTIVEVHEYYDKPLIFVARDEECRFYLGIAQEDQDNHEVHLYVPMSYTIFNHARTGKITALEAIHASSSAVALTFAPYGGDGLPTSSLSLMANDLHADQLPSADLMLSEPAWGYPFMDAPTVRMLHDSAMYYAQEALVARERDKNTTAEQAALRIAFPDEAHAACLVPDEPSSEPTRSILFRSAATLAYRLGLYKQALELIDTGLRPCTNTRQRKEFDDLVNQMGAME